MFDIKIRDIERVLSIAKFAFGKRSGDNIYVSCPFHPNDDQPSCSVDVEQGVFYCHGCQERGPIEKLLAKKCVGSIDEVAIKGVARIFKEYVEEVVTRVVDPSKVEEWHRALLADVGHMLALAQLKGIRQTTIEKYALGWDGTRYTLPIYSETGDCVNVRLRSLEKGVEAKCKNLPKYGKPPRLYPISSLTECTATNSIVITEGELKALLLCQMGLSAISGTGGANAWEPEWAPLFAGKLVTIVYDVDDAGRMASQRVARQLIRYAKEVRIAALPLDQAKHPHGDVTDWVLAADISAEQMIEFLGTAPVYTYQPTNGATAEANAPLIPLESLEQVADPKFHNKHVAVDAVIAAEETDVYRAPIAWKVVCEHNQASCPDCPVHQMRKQEWAFEPWCRIDLLNVVDVPDYEMRDELKDATGIPKQCQAHEIVPTQFANVQMIEMIPDLDQQSKDRDITIPTFLAQKEVGDRRELHNSLHTVLGFPTSDPKSGRLLFLAYDAKPAKESLDRFVVSSPLIESLAKFRPKEWTTESLDEKLNLLYADLEHNVTHIHHRKALHIGYDLAYHSVIGIPMHGRTVKGWVEVAAVGDTGQGKSVAFEALRMFYGAGDLAVGASCTAAGLLGSVQESMRKKRWVYRWGKIPLNDRRLVGIEEAGGLNLEVLQKMRESRSSGRHEDTKAKLTRVSTRTRLVWIANPRGNRPLCEWPHGIAAFQDLFGADADLRRFDFAVFLQSGEVDTTSIRNGQASCAPIASRAEYQSLIRWAWSRRPLQITIEEGVYPLLKKIAAEQSSKFTRRIPLVLDTEHDEKVCRLAAALAARTFSTDESGECLVIRKCHVEWVAAFLDREYSSKACGYDLFTTRVKEEAMVASHPEIKATLVKMPNARSTVDYLLDSSFFSARDLANVSSCDLREVERFIGLLLRVRAVRTNPAMGGTYNKTSGFVELLKELGSAGGLAGTLAAPLDNLSPEDKYASGDF